jgi:hypothetical protein
VPALKTMHIGMPMKGLRRNDDAQSIQCWYHTFSKPLFLN